MKTILTILLALACCSAALAQNKNNLYVDFGINKLGVGITYDRKLTRHFDIGLGINKYDFRNEHYGQSNIPLYLDIRPYWVKRKSVFFLYVDIGAAYYSGTTPDSTTLTHIGLYSALGAGYHYRINKRGMGPYVSVGEYGFDKEQHTTITRIRPEARNWNEAAVYFILSLGFKF